MEGRPVLLVAKGAFHIRSLTNVSLHPCSPPVAPSIVHIDRESLFQTLSLVMWPSFLRCSSFPPLHTGQRLEVLEHPVLLDWALVFVSMFPLSHSPLMHIRLNLRMDLAASCLPLSLCFSHTWMYIHVVSGPLLGYSLIPLLLFYHPVL